MRICLHYKDYEVIFQAFKDLPANFCLLFAGKILTGGADRNYPSKLAKKYGLEDKTVVLNSYISDSKKHFFFYAADRYWHLFCS